MMEKSISSRRIGAILIIAGILSGVVLLHDAIPVSASTSFPVVETSTGNGGPALIAVGTNGTFTFNLPTGSGGISAGDLLIGVFCSNWDGLSASFSGTPPSGWTKIADPGSAPSGSNTLTSAIIFRTATAGMASSVNWIDGNPDAGNSGRMTYQVYRIVGQHPTQAPEAAYASSSSPTPGTSPNPPSLNPVGWGTEKTLWIAGVCFAEGGSPFTNVTGNPSGFTVIRPKDWFFGSGFRAAGVQGDYIQEEVASKDPSAFALSNEQQWHAFTIAVMPDTVVDPLTTNPATGIDSTHALLHGHLFTLYSDTVILSFEWGTTSGLGSRTTNLTRSSIGVYSITLSGLAPNTTYFFRAYSEEVPSGYISHGAILNFTTLLTATDVAQFFNAFIIFTFLGVLTLAVLGAIWIRRKFV